VGGSGVEIHAEPSKIRGMDAIVRMDVSSSFTDTETCGSQAALYGVLDGRDDSLPYGCRIPSLLLAEREALCSLLSSMFTHGTAWRLMEKKERYSFRCSWLMLDILPFNALSRCCTF
jgi:hypothetical protein